MTKSSVCSYVQPSMLANVNVSLAMSPNHIQSVPNLTLDIHGQLTTVKIWYTLTSITCITGSGVQLKCFKVIR